MVAPAGVYTRRRPRASALAHDVRVVYNEIMQTAEAILAVLGPCGTFMSGLAWSAMRRHFAFVDKIEKRLGEYLDKSAQSNALVAEEMRLSRVARESDDQEQRELIAELEKGLGRKIEDKRFSDLKHAIEELRAKRASTDPPPADEAPVSEDPPPDQCLPAPPPVPTPRPVRQKTDPKGRAFAPTAEGVSPRPALRSSSGR